MEAVAADDINGMAKRETMLNVAMSVAVTANFIFLS
jgi:hypothetical protein